MAGDVWGNHRSQRQFSPCMEVHCCGALRKALSKWSCFHDIGSGAVWRSWFRAQIWFLPTELCGFQHRGLNIKFLDLWITFQFFGILWTFWRRDLWRESHSPGEGGLRHANCDVLLSQRCPKDGLLAHLLTFIVGCTHNFLCFWLKHPHLLLVISFCKKKVVWQFFQQPSRCTCSLTVPKEIWTVLCSFVLNSHWWHWMDAVGLLLTGHWTASREWTQTNVFMWSQMLFKRKSDRRRNEFDLSKTRDWRMLFVISKLLFSLGRPVNERGSKFAVGPHAWRSPGGLLMGGSKNSSGIF